MIILQSMFSRTIRITLIKFIQQRTLDYATQNFKKKSKYRMKYTAFYQTIPLYFSAIWGVSKKQDENKMPLTTRDVILAKADALYDQGNYTEIYELLNHYKNDEDVEILWRLCRAMYKISVIVRDDSEAKKIIYEAYKLIYQALSLQEDHWAIHKWFAILLNKKTSYEGTKIKIKELYNIKKHMMRASELNPRDATSLYMTGTWCYQLADLTWYQRQIASTIFTEPPTCLFEEALQYFQRAEDVHPNFYVDNLLMLGKTYLKLNRVEDALKYLKMASEYSAKNDDDQNAKQEALRLLNSI